MQSTPFSSSITVGNITKEDLRPRPRDPKYNKLLPRYYFPERFSAIFHPMSAAVANCLRRTICGELLVKALIAKYDDIETNDIFIIPEVLLARLPMIPLDQSCPIDAIFELKAENETATTRDVSMNEFKIIKNGRGEHMKHIPFNDTTTFITLQPNTRIKISNIRVDQSYSYVKGRGAYCAAVNVSSIVPDDESTTPIDTFDPNSKGVSSSVSDPRRWQIAFTTNGTMSPHDIIVAACDNIIHRLNSFIGLLAQHLMIIGSDDKGTTYSVLVPGESDSLGNAIMRTVLDLYPDIDAVTYSTSTIERSCTIRIRCPADSVEDIFRTTVARLSDLFKSVKKRFE
jgi:DNA-directed RNA polymerase subunit L